MGDQPTTDPDTLVARFTTELEQVWGEPERHASLDAAIERAVAIIGSRTAMVDDHPDLDGLRAHVTCTDDPEEAEVGVTGVLAAAADTGSLALSFGPGTPRATSLVPPEHLAVLPAQRIVATYADVITRIAELDPIPSAVHLVTGPSRSADIELTPIRGVHGPGRVRVLIC